MLSTLPLRCYDASTLNSIKCRTGRHRVIDYEQLFLDSLPLIDRVVGHICRERALGRTEFEDLASAVRVKLIEHEYAVLRTFEGRSSLATFLIVVVRRLYLDQFVHENGRWRPSTRARLLGDPAILLEQLLSRDGIDAAEAIRRVGERHPELGAAAIEALRSQLPQRPSHQRGELLASSPPLTGEEKLLATERQELGRTTAATLEAVLAALPGEERLIMKLRFEDGLKLSTIAVALHLDAKALYRRVDRLLARLRTALEAAGIGPEEASELLRRNAEDVEVTFGDARDTRDHAAPPLGREALP